MNKEVTGGIIGTIVSGVGTGLQTNEVLQTISIVLTIIGTLITITMALLNWYNKAKKDGKITKDEIEEGAKIIKDGVDEIKEQVKKGSEQKDEQIK